MEFLGKLGIDLKLLIAQIINFGVLLWLLTKFVYRPVVKRIEEDEQKLKEAEKIKENLEREKENFFQQKEKEEVKTKKQTAKIIKEAEEIAEAIKKETQQKSEEEINRLLKQYRAKFLSQEDVRRKEISKDLKNRIDKNLIASWQKNIPVSLLKNFQEKIFFPELLIEVKKLDLENTAKSALTKSLKKIEKQTTDAIYEKEMKKIFQKKIGPIVLEHAFPLNTEAGKELEKLLTEKIGFFFSLKEKSKSSLLSGFRFEIAGYIIETNLKRLLSDNLDYAFKIKK